MGVRPGDRVGIYLRKSIDAVAAIYGILKAGAAYVPVDPGAPAGAERVHPAQLRGEGRRHGGTLRSEAPGRARDAGRASAAARARLGRRRTCAAPRARRARTHARRRRRARRSCRPPGDLAYILYTSGSTGQAEGRDALARERRELRRLVLRGLRAAAERPLLVARAVPLRPLDPRHPRPAQARRDAGARRRGHRQGPRTPRRADRRAADLDLVLGAVDPRAARPVRQARPPRLLRRCGTCCSPARCSRSSICAR